MIIQQNWRQLSSIQMGGAICLSSIMVGHTLNQNYGFAAAIIAILIGNTILLLLGLVSAKMSYEKRKTTVDNAMEYFGERGVLFFSSVMSLSLLGWFAIQLNMMSLSVLDFFSVSPSNFLPGILLNFSFGVLITLGALKGLRALTYLANLSVPFLIVTLLYSMLTLEQEPQTSAVPFSLKGVSLVIAVVIAGVIDLPTYLRHARTNKDSFICIVIIFGLTLPFLEMIGVYLALGSSGETILEVLKRQNGPFWNLWVALFLILAGWTTNNLNLYSGVICLGSIFKNYSPSKQTIVFGGLGAILSCFNLLKHFELILGFMGVLIASMGAVIITRYSLVQSTGIQVSPQNQRWHLIAWVVGMFLGFLSMSGISLTSIAVLDATIGASLATFLVIVKNIKGSYEKAYNA